MSAESSGVGGGLAELVTKIEEIVRTQTVEPKLMAIPGERQGRYAIVTPTKLGEEPKIAIKVTEPLWHNERLDTPEQLVKFIESAKDARGLNPANAAVYIGESAVRFVFDFEDRRNRATLPLEVSEPWAWLVGGTRLMDQRALIRLLRITFADALPAESGLISVIRNVKWKQNGEIESNLQRGKEALGRQILNEAAGISDFPDEFIVTVRVFKNVPFTVDVKVALELLPEQQKFEVIPFPNQVHDGLHEVLGKLQEQIAETDVPTFIGAAAAGKQDSE